MVRAVLLTGLFALGLIIVARAQSEPFPGNPPVTPRWAFEPWVWEDHTNTQASTESLVQGYLDRDIPVGAVIVDSPWETGYNDFLWDPSRYPDPPGLIDTLHNRGVRVLLWITGFVNNDSADYSFIKSQGYGINNGQDFDWWKGTGVHIDFTSPSAKSWWHTRMDRVLNMGIDGWKADMGADTLPDTVSTSLGVLPRDVFKKYYYADFYDYSTSRNPQAICFARPYSSSQGGAGAPVSRLPAGWGGDYAGDFDGLEQQKVDLYLSAQLGYSAPGIEVGGFSGVSPTKHSLLRYAQLGAMAPIMENGGWNGGEAEHLPWYWDQETVDIYRYFATLHSELTPYLFSYSVEANRTGLSILRETDLERSQHKLGEELFVSVLNTDVSAKAVFFPSGGPWIDYWDEAAVYESGVQANYSVPLNRYPIFLRAGAILPLNVQTDLTGHGDSTSAGKVTLAIYPYGQSSLEFHRPTGDGTDSEDVRIEVDEAAGTVRVDGNSTVAYRLRVKSFTSPSAVTGADRWSYDAAREVIVMDRQGQDFVITIGGLEGYSGKPTKTPAASSATLTKTSSPTATATRTPTATSTSTATRTPTATATVTGTSTLTATATPMPTSTASPTATASPTVPAPATSTDTPAGTATPSATTDVWTPASTATLTPTLLPIVPTTPEPTPAWTATPTSSNTRTLIPLILLQVSDLQP